MRRRRMQMSPKKRRALLDRSSVRDSRLLRRLQREGQLHKWNLYLRCSVVRKRAWPSFGRKCRILFRNEIKARKKGKSCEKRECLKPCENGFCVDGTCKCAEGFSGIDCSEKTCPNNCSKHGTYVPIRIIMPLILPSFFIWLKFPQEFPARIC